MAKTTTTRLSSFILAALNKMSDGHQALRDVFGSTDNEELAVAMAMDIDNMALLPLEERRDLTDAELELVVDTHIRCVLAALLSDT